MASPRWSFCGGLLPRTSPGRTASGLRKWVKIMTKLPALLLSLPVVSTCSSANASSAGSAYKHGIKAEASNNYDQAFEAFRQAHEAKPKDLKYLEAYLRLRFYAANEHVHKCQLLLGGGKLTEALAEFQRAAEIDRSNFLAQQEFRRTTY